ncbi:sulfur carrier protein ThiS [Roseovarius sp. M141]|uniref:sulfur carrier protein ThiS n=1 Tax=Roseovarius sp. M141 TaxID=2583806 RepID=UPI0020CE2BED|nr:sulfur carrier protein ThiS [Roseovarius sp. M141]MCQ0091974.1 sulfur carrier protein ThiS [Roseovarius sp. M141]
MMIDVNGAAHKIDAANLAAALEQLGWGEARVATALNGRFVPVSQRPNTPLSAGDRLEVLTAMQGG